MAHKLGTWRIKKEQERLFNKYGENYRVVQRSQPAPAKGQPTKKSYRKNKTISIPVI